MSRRRTSMLLALLLSSCATTSPLEVNSAYAPGKAGEIAAYRTYAWSEQPAGTDPQLYPPGVEKNVKDAVNRILQERGYQLAGSPDQADFLVGWHAAIDTKLETSYVDVHYGYYYGPYWGTATPVVQEYSEGSLVLDVADAKSNTLVWRGSAAARIEPNVSEDEKRRRIDYAAGKILERFPPKPE